MPSKLNVIVNPVRRWFHQDKEIIDTSPLIDRVWMAKDSHGNDVVCMMGTATYEMRGDDYMTPEQFVYWLSGLLSRQSKFNSTEILEKVKAGLKEVKITQNSGDIVACFTGDSP